MKGGWEGGSGEGVEDQTTVSTVQESHIQGGSGGREGGKEGVGRGWRIKLPSLQYRSHTYREAVDEGRVGRREWGGGGGSNYRLYSTGVTHTGRQWRKGMGGKEGVGRGWRIKLPSLQYRSHTYREAVDEGRVGKREWGGGGGSNYRLYSTGITYTGRRWMKGGWERGSGEGVEDQTAVSTVQESHIQGGGG